MEKPKCKVCGVRHYNREPHVYEGAESVKAKGRVTKNLTSRVTAGSVIPNGISKQERWKRRNAKKHQEYRREYMRAYRKRTKDRQKDTD